MALSLMDTPKDWHWNKTMVNTYIMIDHHKRMTQKLLNKPYHKAPFRLLDLPVELQRMIIKEYYSSKIIRASGATTQDNVHVFSEIGPLLVSRNIHKMAKEAIREAKCDTVVLTHYGMAHFRRKACVDIMLDFVPHAKVAAKDIRTIRYDFGPQLRYNQILEKFPNIERVVSIRADGGEHAVVRDEGAWISEDLLKRLRSKP